MNWMFCNLYSSEIRWTLVVTRLFYKQHYYKQRQAEIGKKIKQMLSNTLRLNFCYLKIIHILHRGPLTLSS